MNSAKCIFIIFIFSLTPAIPAAAEITYSDILLSPAKYVGNEITMHGEFRYKNTERKSFDMRQGDNTIEIFYERLPAETQAVILSQSNFSRAPVMASGTLRRFANRANSYYIMASDVQGLAQEKESGTGVRYTEILLSPEKYVGNEITMHGEFRYKNTERKSFDMRQGDNTIEIFYERLPTEAQAVILSESNFSRAPVMASGTLRRFANRARSYYIMATDVSWE